MKIHWKFKSTVFAFIDLFSLQRLLYFIQKHVTGRSRIVALNINENWKRHEDALKKYNANKLLLEFGAGQNLAQNLYLSSTVDKQVVVDLNPMLDVDLSDTARKLLSSQIYFRSNKEINSPTDLTTYGIEYRAPFDVSNTDFETGSFDASISTNTLEHIPEESIVKIFKELHRILRKKGIVSAKIDYTDHYAHTDSSITLLNYLHFSDLEWKKFNHNCHYQNRLRHYDYLRIFEACKFKIVEEEIVFEEKNIPTAIIKKYADKPKSWAATSAYILLMKD